jgi:hypothetical protein
MYTLIHDDDERYFNWLATNPRGFVVNSYLRPIPSYLVLHRSTCRHIQRRKGKRSTKDYIKICSTQVDELRNWARDDVNGKLVACGSCHPN